METAISNLSILPQNKQERETFVQKVKTEILNGDYNPLDVDIYFKNLEETIKAIRKDEDIKNLILEECEKYNNKSFEYKGNLITVTSRTTYDYSSCGDSQLDEINKLIEELEAKKKAREAILKNIDFYSNIVDAQTGEVIKPPVKKVTTVISYKLK